MPQPRTQKLLSRLVGYTVLTYGLIIVAGTLVRQLQTYRQHDIDSIFSSLPLLIGLGYIYLANLLLRLKYNAWLIACILSLGTIGLTIFEVIYHNRHMVHGPTWLRIGIPVLILFMLLASQRLYRVRSDMRSFIQAVRTSTLILLVTFLYGIGGFCLFDTHDFHQEISLLTAMHQTIDQFGLTTKTLIPHSRRAVLFVNSLGAISIGAVAYVALAFFQPIRMNLTGQHRQRELAKKLLEQYPNDIDDFFKLWPHDKHYFFDSTFEAGLAYHVTRGNALVAADLFGIKKQFPQLLTQFEELCFVNDWTPCFVHISKQNERLYKKFGYKLQKIGEEALLDITVFKVAKRSKYFRQIHNRFTKLGYQVELLQPPHSTALVSRLRTISDEWLARPGRAERGFMLGYFNEAYLQQGPVAIVRDDAQQIQGFINLVPTYKPHTANYDLLRCANDTPGNINDFLLLSLLDALAADGVQTLNLGLCPLSGLDEKATDANIIDTALRFVYANGDRFYSFSGLRRFKGKYDPEWHGRYVAYKGGIAGFTRGMAALTRAMKVK